MILGTVGEVAWLTFIVALSAVAYAAHVIHEAWKGRHA